mgnify:CR=1 FL=1
MDSTTASKNDSKNNADVLKWLRGLFAKQLDAEKHARVRIPSSPLFLCLEITNYALLFP